MNAIKPMGNPARSAPTYPDLDKITSTILKASSIATLMGWAAIGQEYANPAPKDAPSGFDYANAAKVVADMLEDVCGTIETLKTQQGGE